MPHFLLALLVAGAEPDATNPLYKTLLEPGLAVAGDAKVKLPPPTMADGLDAAKQKAVLEKLIGNDYSYDEFTRNSVVAPFKMVIRDEKSSDETLPARAVDVWFVAYGDFAAVDDEKFLERLLNSGRGTGGKTTEVPPAELTKRKITIPPELAKREHFGQVEFDFLDKVRLKVTGHTVWSKSADSLVAAVEVDPRFENAWLPITKDGDGVKLGKPAAYSGVGLYVKLTKLAEPAGAVFVEQHVVFTEPTGWFDGSNLLRSKLPPAMMKTVRSMRTEWAKGK